MYSANLRFPRPFRQKQIPSSQLIPSIQSRPLLKAMKTFTRFQTSQLILALCLLVGFINLARAQSILVKQNFYVSGGVKTLESEYQYYLENEVEVKHGYFRSFSEDGNRKLVTAYQHGLEHGTSEQWNPDGTIHERQEYRGGLRNGSYQRWDTFGTLISEGEYRDGEKAGIWSSYYSDGELSIESPYVAGRIEGTQTRYNRYNGNPSSIETIQYLAGVRHGPSSEVSVDGSWVIESTYDEGYEQGPYSHTRYLPGGGIVSQVGTMGWDGAFSSERCGIWTFTEPGRNYTQDYGPCNFFDNPNFPPVPPAKTDPDPDDDGEIDTKVITGQVRDRARGNLLSGVLVESGAISTTTGSDGRYELELDAATSYPLKASVSNYYGRSGTIDMTDVQSRTFNFTLKAKPPAPDHSVTGVESKWGKMFLAGIPFNNEFTVNVDWNDRKPGSVEASGAGSSGSVNPGSGPATILLNMGAGTPSTSPRANPILFTATDGDGIVAKPFKKNVAILPIPEWSTPLGEFSISENKGVYTYGLSSTIPEEKLEIRISEQTLGPTLWAGWSLFPLIGGQNLGIPPSQAEAAVEVSTNGTGSVTLVGVTGFEVGGQEFEGKLGGKGHIQYKTGEGLDWTGTTFIGGAQGSLKKTVGPVTLIPALENSVNLPVVGRAIKWFNGVAEIEGEVYVGADLNLKIIHGGDGVLAFENASGTWETGLKASLGTDISSKIKTKLTGSGDVTIAWQTPANPSYFKSAQARLLAELELTAWNYTKTFTAEHKFPAEPSPRDSADEGGFSPIPRDFIARAPYNVFTAAERSSDSAGGNGGPVRSSDDIGGRASESLVGNVYPYAEPAMANAGANSVILYVYSDPNDPVLQANEIYYSVFDGSKYSKPTAIVNDTKSEFAPTVAMLDSDTAVAAWERVKTPDFDGAGIADLASLLEIVYAVYTVSTDTWTTPVALTDNDYLDHTPRLARSPAGGLALIWESNAANELLSSSAAPTNLSLALWDGSAFSAPTQAPNDFADAFAFACAHNGAQTTIVYTQDGDGDIFTDTDQELYALTYEGGAWDAPARLTDNAVADNHPYPLYLADGSRELLWVSGGDLVHRTTWDSNTETTIRGDSVSATFLDFRATVGADGRFAILWQAQQETNSCIEFALYDPSTGTWSKDIVLTGGLGEAFDPAPAIDADGKLQAAYLETTEDPDSGLVTVGLCHVARGFELDLGFAASGPSVSGAITPGAGVTLEVPVTNFGALPAENATVSLFRSEGGNARATLLDTQVLAPVLVGGATSSATFNYIVPDPLLEDTLFLSIDEGGAITESDEANNTRVWPYALPDLRILDAVVQDNGNGSYALVATVANLGATVAENIEVALSTAEVFGEPQLIAKLLPGKVADVAFEGWSDIDFTSADTDLLVTVDPSAIIDESDEANNDRSVVLSLEIDRDADGLPDWWEEEMVLARNDDNLLSIDDIKPEGDDDGDGQSNISEYAAKTDPLDPFSVFYVEAQRGATDNELILTWPAVPGITYQVQSCTDLRYPLWQNLDLPVSLVSGDALTITVTRQADREFYRVIVVP